MTTERIHVSGEYTLRAVHEIYRQSPVIRYSTNSLQNLLKNQLNSGNSKHCSHCHSRLATRQHGHAFGKLLGTLTKHDELSQEHWRKVLKLLNAGNNTSAQIAALQIVNGEETDENIRQCDCGEYQHPESMSYSEDAGTSHCDSCADEWNWSTIMDDHIRADESYSYYATIRRYHNGSCDHVTRDYAERNSLNEYNDEYFSDDAYEDIDCHDEEEDEDDSNKHDGLADYHCSCRNFVERAEGAHPALGVELEVYCENRADVVHDLIRLEPDWYYERDSSLSASYGFEIVTQPLGYTEWREAAKPLLALLREGGAVGYDTPGSNCYGIHINIHRRHLSALQEARLLMFMCASENRDFMVSVAQRATIYGGDATQIGAFAQHSQTIGNLGGISRHKKIVGIGKYSPINIYGDIAEIRIFQSTTLLPSFMKNLEFIWALVEWTSTKSATGHSWMHADFIRWLGQHRGAEQTYPYLFAYLRKPSYMGKGFLTKVKNTWAHLLPTQTTKSLDVISGNQELALAA